MELVKNHMKLAQIATRVHRVFIGRFERSLATMSETPKDWLDQARNLGDINDQWRCLRVYNFLFTF